MPDIFPIGDRQSLTLEDCKHLITKGHVVLPGQLEKVAVRMFEQPELIAFQSAAAVAKKCGVSQTTVVRLAHHLGIGSYRRLKKLCGNYILEHTSRSR